MRWIKFTLKLSILVIELRYGYQKYVGIFMLKKEVEAYLYFARLHGLGRRTSRDKVKEQAERSVI